MKRIAFLLLLGGLLAQPVYFIIEAADRAERARQAQDAKLLQVLDLYGRSIIGLIDAGLATPDDPKAAAGHKERMRAQASLDKFARELIDRRARPEPATEFPSVIAVLKSALRLSLNPGYALLCSGAILLFIDARKQRHAKMG